MMSKLVHVIAFGCTLLATGCGNNESAILDKPVVTREDLLAFNQEKALHERAFIDSLVTSMHNATMPHYVETATGLRAWSSEPFRSESKWLEPGDTVQWVGGMALTDSTVLLDWTKDESLRFVWQQSDWPAGFHELASLLEHDQRATCIVPSHLGWGLTGYPPLIPQEAVLVLRIRQQLMNRTVQPLNAKGENRAVWNALLDQMEQGVWPGDSDWIHSPTLAASPCMAWFEGASAYAFDQRPVHMGIELRTFRLTPSDEMPEDLGTSSWDFAATDEGQLLPVLADLQRLYPNQRKWSCWCPADEVLDEAGRAAVGVTAADVLGFQWQFEALDPPITVQ